MLDAILVFAKVAEIGSFSAAAKVLRQPKATVSRKIAELELELGARLLNRTTRALSLTDVGRRYLEHAQRIVSELEAAQSSVDEAQAEPLGQVRLTAPLALAQELLAPVLAEYARLYPKVRVSLDATNRRVDIVEEGIDLALRVGEITDSRLIVRSLGVGAAKLYASRHYLEKAGIPNQPKDLSNFTLIDDNINAALSPIWKLQRREESVTIKVQPQLAVNDSRIILAWTLAGQGISRLPEFIAANLIASGDLIAILPEWTASTAEVSLLFPSARHITPAIRCLIDLLYKEVGSGLRAKGAHDATSAF